MDLTKHPIIEQSRRDFKQNRPGAIQQMSPAEHEDGLAMCRYLLSQYIGGRTFGSTDGVLANNASAEAGSTIAELRAYATDSQGAARYRAILQPADLVDIDGKVGSELLNISWRVPSIVSPIRSIAGGMFSSVTFDTELEAVDPASRKERLLKKARRITSLSPEVTAMTQATNMRPQGEEDMTNLKTPEDVDILYRMGGDRLTAEIQGEAMLKLSEASCDYAGVVTDQLKDDLVNLGFCAQRVSCNPLTRVPEYAYVDPAGAIVPQSKYRDFRDATYGGELRMMALYEIREILHQQGLDEETTEQRLLSIVDRYRSAYGTHGPRPGEPGQDHFRGIMAEMGTPGQNNYRDDFRVLVLDGSYIAAEAEKYVVGNHHRTRGTIFKRVNLDAKLSKTDKRRRRKSFERRSVSRCFRALWVVGSEVLLDYGIDQATVERDEAGIKHVQLPYIFYSTHERSIISRMIPYVDEICIATFRKRDSLAKMVPGPGWMIDHSRIEPDLFYGRKKYTFSELAKLAMVEGILHYRSTPQGQLQGYPQGSGIEPLDNSAIVAQLQIYQNIVQQNMAEIRKSTGINEGVDGSAPRDMLVGVQKGLEAATNNALMNTFRSYYHATLRAKNYCLIKWQIALLAGEIDLVHTPIAHSDIDVPLVFSEELSTVTFGIKVHMAPTDDEKQRLLQFLQARHDQGSIDAADYFYVETCIRSGAYKKAQLYLAIAMDRKRRQDEQNELQKITYNAEQQQQSARVATQEKAKQLQQETEAELQKMEYKYDREVELARLKIGEQGKVDATIKGAQGAAQIEAAKVKR